ncbi:MAG: hypothetical protein HQL49_03715 [Gammaproteobacteria bacterium]|nr:hypothetical protein [Gammaproteobacteria bacterium]
MFRYFLLIIGVLLASALRAAAPVDFGISSNPAAPAPAAPVTSQPLVIVDGPFAGIELSSEQQRQVEALMLRQQTRHQQRVEELSRIQQKLQQIYLQELWDVDAIDRLYADSFTYQREAFRDMARAHNEIMDLLTPLQKQQLQRRVAADSSSNAAVPEAPYAPQQLPVRP